MCIVLIYFYWFHQMIHHHLLDYCNVAWVFLNYIVTNNYYCIKYFYRQKLFLLLNYFFGITLRIRLLDHRLWMYCFVFFWWMFYNSIFHVCNWLSYLHKSKICSLHPTQESQPRVLFLSSISGIIFPENVLYGKMKEWNTLFPFS